MEDYYFYKSLGICVKCRKYSAVQGKVRCEFCTVKAAEKGISKRENMTMVEREQHLKKQSEWNKKLYHRRKDAGLCTRCGRPQAKNSNMLCIECLIKERERGRKRSYKRRGDTIPRIELPNYGICYQCCKKPIMEGKRLCADCYGRTLASLQIAMASDGARKERERFREKNSLFFTKKTSCV